MWWVLWLVMAVTSVVVLVGSVRTLFRLRSAGRDAAQGPLRVLAEWGDPVPDEDSAAWTPQYLALPGPVTVPLAGLVDPGPRPAAEASAEGRLVMVVFGELQPVLVEVFTSRTWETLRPEDVGITVRRWG